MVANDQVRLVFGTGSSDVVKDLSAVHRDRSWLWLAGDELPRLERLTADADDAASYGDHRSFAIGEFIDLPEGPHKEVDVEGLDGTGDFLWLVGSHSRTRARAKKGDSDAEVVVKLSEVRDHPNRHVLVRLPVVEEGSGPIPVRSVTAEAGQRRTAAVLAGDLTAALAKDALLGPFLAIPSKDNGLDIEGLAAFGDHVLVGLRGSVLRGWAVILKLILEEDAHDPTRLILRSVSKRFADLDGLGVRDLCRDGDDVLILAGPTMDLDGPVHVYRWHDAAHFGREVVRGDAITRVADVPFGVDEDRGKDHAEGITLAAAADGSLALLTVYDSPSKARTASPGTIVADVLTV